MKNDLSLLSDWTAKLSRTSGGAVAIVDYTTGKEMTFAEFDDRRRRLANALAALGLQPGDRVAMLLSNCYVSAELIFGIASAAMVKVCVNERLRPIEIEYILRDSGARAVVTSPAGSRLIEAVIANVPSIEHIIIVGDESDSQTIAGVDVHDYEQVVAAASADEPEIEVDPATTAMLIYTSGTTGRPKGVMLTQRNLVDSATNYLIESFAPARACYIACVPYFHVGCIVHIAALLRGYTVVVCAFDVTRVLDAIEEHRATHIAAVPTAIAMLLDAPDIELRNLSSLRRVLYAASPMPAATLRRGIERFGSIFEQFYGLTETTGLVTILHPDDHDLENPTRLRSCGREVARVSVRLVGTDGAEVPVGEPGEILVSGANVMAGYWNQPDATEEAMVDGWFRTGDVATIDSDGFLCIVDRLKDMIITGGSNVYPREVEEVLIQHPAINDVAIVGVPDARWGEMVAAVVVPTPGADGPDEASLELWLRDRLASYKRPRHIRLVDALPRNAMGKVDKNLLRADFESQP